MRYQGSSSNGAIPFDLASLVGDETLTPEKMKEVIESIWDPSVQLIDPTFGSGRNTRTLISLCHKIADNAKIGSQNATRELKAIANSVEDLTKIAVALCAISTSGKLNAEDAESLNLLGNAQESKSQLYEALGYKTKEFEQSARTMIKLGDALLADQIEKGSDIKTGVSLLRYTFTCRAINSQWENVSKDFAEIAKLLEKAEKLAESYAASDETSAKIAEIAAMVVVQGEE